MVGHGGSLTIEDEPSISEPAWVRKVTLYSSGSPKVSKRV